MNAKQAKIAAQTRATELQKERENKARKEGEQSAKKWREERANWEKNHLAWIERDIVDAVNKGQTKASIWLATSDEPEQAQEDAFWQRTAFAPELKRVIAHFKALDYTLKFRVKKEEHVDLSDLSPVPNWFTYETTLDVSW